MTPGWKTTINFLHLFTNLQDTVSAIKKSIKEHESELISIGTMCNISANQQNILKEHLEKIDRRIDRLEEIILNISTRSNVSFMVDAVHEKEKKHLSLPPVES